MAVAHAILIVASLLGSVAMAAQPDLTGVWGNSDSRGLGGGRGITTDKPPVLLPEAKRRVDAYNALVGPVGATPGGVCLGYGTPQAMLTSGGYPMEIIQRPEQITFIHESHGDVRRAYFGERNAPPEDRVPGRNGYSSGRWEGDTLVVETDNLIDQVDQRITPHSDAATIVERYRIEGKDAQGRRLLVAEMVLTDPAFYAEPVVMTKRWTEVPNGRILAYDCNEERWLELLEELASKAGVPVP